MTHLNFYKFYFPNYVDYRRCYLPGGRRNSVFSSLIYFRRDIVLPGDLFTGTSNWPGREEDSQEEQEGGEAEEDGEPGVMTRW